MPSKSTDPKALVRTKHPGIYKRGNRYVVTWKENGKARKQFCPTIAQALQVQGDRRDPTNRSTANRELFRDYAEDWLANYNGRTSRGLAELTREDYRRIMDGHLLPHFGNTKLGEIQAPDVRSFLTSLERKGLSTGRVRKIKAPLSALFATAVEDGTLRVNPAANVRVVGRDDDAEDAEVRALTNDELATFLDAVKPKWRFFFEFLYRTGLRISEAVGLTWADVEFGAQPCVHIHQQFCRGKRRGLKTKASRRTLPLSPETAKRLWKMRAQAESKTAPVFATRVGTPYSSSNIANRVLIPARDTAGLPWVTFHTFRHTCASMLFEQGQDIIRVQHWLGHESAAFTAKVYVHLRDSNLGSADFFDASLVAARPTEAPQDAAPNAHPPGGMVKPLNHRRRQARSA